GDRMRDARDQSVTAPVLGLVVLMFAIVLALSQVEAGFSQAQSPWGKEPNWQKPLALVDNAVVCPSQYGIEAYFDKKTTDCFHWAAQPVTVLDRTDHWVYVRTASGHGWTWWGQLSN